MKCQDIQSQLTDLISNQLGHEMREQVTSHLESCPSCRQEFEQLQSVWNDMGTMEQDKPGPQLRPRFYAMLDVYQNELKTSSKSNLSEKMNSWLGTHGPVCFCIPCAICGQEHC